ncbi:phage integrase SAM-like domain-containing protein [Arcicella sp. DC2W]|uniref:Phage integrase SAM-like domain-containing protein n=1 Tax=Arcicella gelida TaxID=2984195 RepID=A0ABU5S2A8_9BACT|nr:phage integrase SAM-like domain-containing protein [Arcicella sp. DC2W]MEA5402591.1 phage integrase SAM-like domain-containing protein [Arcicella sp. DC2W]
MEILFIRHRCKDVNFSKIYTKISYNGERLELGSTNIKIATEDWDIEKKRVRSNAPNASIKNEILATIESDIFIAYNDLLRKKKSFNVKMLKEAILKVGENEVDLKEPSFIEVFDMFLIAIKEPDPLEQREELSKGTLTKYKNVRDSLLNFFIYEKQLNLKISEFDVNKLRKFRSWMKNIQAFAPLTVHKRCQVVKQVAKWGFKNLKQCHHTPIYDIMFKEPEPDENIFLTQDQFEILKNHKFRTKAKQEVADVFVLYCRTGFHYADLKEIIKNTQNDSNINKAERKGIDGEKWLFKARVKTTVTAKVPYFQEVHEIIEKYGGWQNIPIKSNAKMNDTLKLIADELGFPEELILKISVKAGRKTLSDWLLNVKGWTNEALMVLLGIKNEKYVKRYAKPDERRVILEMKRNNQ